MWSDKHKTFFVKYSFYLGIEFLVCLLKITQRPEDAKKFSAFVSWYENKKRLVTGEIGELGNWRVGELESWGIGDWGMGRVGDWGLGVWRLWELEIGDWES